MMVAAVLGLSALTAGRARAGTVVNFSYSGRGGPDMAGLISTGTGSFSFGCGIANVTLADLRSFDFSLSENTPNSATFGLADLTSFSAFVNSGTTLTVLSLDTGPVQGTNSTTYPREFAVSSLGEGYAYSSFYIGFLDKAFNLTSGTVTITSVVSTVPEPSTLTLALIGGALFVAGTWFRRRTACATA
jgi:hypothetical protein